MKILRIVIDTNLLIAAFFNRESSSAQILRGARENRLKIIWSQPIKKEAEYIFNNISRSLKEPQRFNQRFKGLFKPNNKVRNLPNIKVVKDDPEDNKLIACAIKGKADYLVSSDHHLLDLEGYQGTKILKPSRLVEKLGL